MILNTLTRSCQASRYQIICHHFPFVCPLHLFPTESIQSILSTTLNHRLYLSLPTLVQLIFLQSAPRASQSWKYHFTTSLLPHNTKQHTAMSEEGNFLSWLANELAAHARACACVCDGELEILQRAHRSLKNRATQLRYQTRAHGSQTYIEFNSVQTPNQ